jgi:hypothetical protein
MYHKQKPRQLSGHSDFVTDWTTEEFEFNFEVKTIKFSLLHCPDAGSGAQSASFLVVKRPSHTYFASFPKKKQECMEFYLHFPIYVHNACFIKNGENFTVIVESIPHEGF